MVDAPHVTVDANGSVAGSRQVQLIVDDDGICLEASLGACRLLGTSRADVVGLAFGELLEPASRERFTCHWSSVRKAGGRVGTFALASPASVEVDASVTPQLLPGRHLIALEATLDLAMSGGGRSAVHGQGRGPSAREREILDLLADGATDDQIAAKLAVSPATVQTHVRNAKAKLGARTRAQAVALALQRGLIGA
jgi:DNA-binding CsgD family transcriptional regulator